MTVTLHPLLTRQLKRCGMSLDEMSLDCMKFITTINDAYLQADKDRVMLERSLELSSKELLEQNIEMRKTLESFPEILQKAGPVNKNLGFRELLLNHVLELQNSRDELVRQAVMLQNQAIEIAEARDAALAASRAKSIFLANMSHEIRTPMNGALGMLKIALATNLDKEQREYLTYAEESTLSLLSLVNDILDFSKIEAGKLDLEFAEFEIRKNLNLAIRTVSYLANDKGLELIAEIDPNVPRFVISDGNRLRQVLVNLLGNAVKFTLQGHVKLQVKFLGPDVGGNSLISFSIQDTGIGIAPDKHKLIFDAFQQVDESVSRSFGGTGLGLNITKQLVTMLGGEIKLDSKIGSGSEFSFILSVKTSDKRNEAESNFIINQDTLSKFDVKPLKVLVVDDILVNRIVAEKILEQQGHEAVCLDCGSELIRIIKEGSDLKWPISGYSKDCDVILLDIQMPELDGIETARQIRTWEKEFNSDKVHVPIIALTAHALKGDRERFLEAGMDDYLSKPIEPDALSLVLSRANHHHLQSLAETKMNKSFEKGSHLNLEATNPEPISECLIKELSLDENQLLGRFGGSWEIVNEIVDAFIEEYEELSNAVVKAVANGDDEEIRKAAHAFKGSLLNVCGIKSSKIAHLLELAAKERVGDYDQLCSELVDSGAVLKNDILAMTHRHNG